MEEKLCPDCGEMMKVRENDASGDLFWGCSEYPFCKHAEPIEPDTPYYD